MSKLRLYDDIIKALDVMPEKKLGYRGIFNDGCLCVGQLLARTNGVEKTGFSAHIEDEYSVSPCTTYAIIELNDETSSESQSDRWQRVRKTIGEWRSSEAIK